MSGILLPGQESQPRPSEEEQPTRSSGIELPSGYSRSRDKQREPQAPSTNGEQAQEAAAGAAADKAPAADKINQPAGSQPRGASNAGRGGELLFPPTGAQIQCPNCGTPYTTAVFSIIDTGVNPELKQALLGGQVNMAICPSCGAGGPLSSPLMVHEPAHNFLGVYIPGSLAGAGQGMPQMSAAQRERAIGDLSQALMKRLPNEAKRGYMLQPQQFLDWNRFLETLWGFEGVTPEMLRRQRDQSTLLEALVRLADDESALDAKIEREQRLLDRQFFSLLDQMLQLTAMQGQQETAQRLESVRERLLDTTEAGREIQALQNKIRDILASFEKAPSRESLLETLMTVWETESGEEGENGNAQSIVTALAMTLAPIMDYQFLLLIADRLEESEDETERERLTQTRNIVLSLQERQRQSEQAVLQQAQQILQEVLQSANVEEALRQYADYIDDTFLGLLAANVQQAEKNKATAAARRLRQIYDQAIAILQESMPPAVQLVNRLMSAPDRNALREIIKENRDQIDGSFIELLVDLEGQMRQAGQKQQADAIKSLRGQVALAM